MVVRVSLPLAFLLLAMAASASAQDVAAAAAAFQRAQQAQLRGEHARAAELYELADRAAPSAEALRSAMRMHVEAGNRAHAATLALEAERRYPDDEVTLALAAELIAAANAENGRLAVHCEPACTLVLGGRVTGTSARAEHDLFHPPGSLEIVARWPEGGSATETVTLIIGERVELALAPPAPAPEPVQEPEPEPAPPEVIAPPTPAPAAASGLHPAFFAVGAALTAVGAGLIIGFGVDTLDARDAYVAAPTRQGYEDGLDREWRTNGAIIGTSIVAAATFVIALVTDWDGESADVSVAIGADGAIVGAEARF